ncbi:protein THEMIS2 [Hippocampus zosterae]|uniref:protein THEMIS2 n=1 Tax=Hippocampus zosterae TaxID=109293 RepID=UPI00223DA96F|nr:protein THEMIS2 [Hippocampus zosterae]
MAFPLLQYVATLDGASLPRILRVCSGVYFQGSVYEISGNEVCFSTGDVIKVTGIELSSVCCQDVDGDETFELPLDHAGLLTAIPEAAAYDTVEEVVKAEGAGSESRPPVTFTSRSEVALADVTLGAGAVLTVISVAQEERRCRCRLHPGPGRPQVEVEAEAEVDVPLATRGQFYVSRGHGRFTPREIVTSAHLRGRRFRFDDGAASRGALVLSPVYQICAIMSLRKDVLRFPSSLAMDVADITDTCGDVGFVTPLSLPEVHSQSEESFPAVVEVLEGPEMRSVLKSAWLPQLRAGARLIFHGRATSPMTVVSGGKSRQARRYFLVSERYAGRFRRRPRAFDSAYELYAASAQTPALRVSAARDCEEAEEEGLPGLSVGERLEVLGRQKVRLPCGPADAVACVRLRDADDEGEDEEDEEVGAGRRGGLLYLPLHMQGRFVELLSDNKKYALKALGDKLPLDVKAVSRDPEMESDPLVGLPSLRLLGVTLEPTIRASFLHAPHLCFEIPTRRLGVSVCRTRQPLPWPPDRAPECAVEPVTEVTEEFLHQFQKEALPVLSPPPRPPKRCPAAPTRDFGAMTIRSRGSSLPPPAQAGVSHRPPTVASRESLTPRASVPRATPNSDARALTSDVDGPAREDAAVKSDDDNYEQVEDVPTATPQRTRKSVGFF